MSKINSGMYKVYENEFLVGDTKETASFPSHIKSFSVTVDDGTEEWNDFDNGDWTVIAATNKKMTFKLSVVRDIGNTGNDYLASKSGATGDKKEGYFKYMNPDGTTYEWTNAIYKTEFNGGDIVNKEAFDTEITSNGRPTITTTTSAEA